MDRFELDQAVNRQIEQAYWPWWFAVAYVQPQSVRQEAMRAGCRHDTGGSLSACGSLGAVVEIAADLRRYDRDEFSQASDSAEAHLLQAIRSGRIKTFGRENAGRTLVEIPPSAWVGAEINCYDTCDLLAVGYRESAKDWAALLHHDRKPWFVDVHLSGADVKAVFPSQGSPLPRGAGATAPAVPSIAPPLLRFADAPQPIKEWLADAIDRKVPVREAYADARKVLGQGVLRQQEAQGLLKEAMADRDMPVPRGRPHGRKTGARL